MARLVFAVAVLFLSALGAKENEDNSVAKNPIRRVVTMLQKMQEKVTAEGVKEKAMFEKFMCYCQNSGGDVGKSIASANVKIPEVGSDIEEAENQKVQLDDDLKRHRADRSDAQASMKEATALRGKEAAAFSQLKHEHDTNIDALTRAIAALSKGMAGGFLQTDAAQVLKNLMLSKQNIIEGDRQEILSFLSGAQGEHYAPQGGEINGILKQLRDEMLGFLAAATATEEGAIASYGGLMSAKGKEVAALTKAIEKKLIRGGELAVSIAQMKNDLSDTQAALLEDQKFLANLKGNCETKKTEWAVVVKTRAEELVALAETIKILNDDDALELFKKTLPSASASFVELKQTNAVIQARALAMIRNAQSASRPIRDQLDFIALALHGKKIGFEKIVAMIDRMVVTLNSEQTEDDNKREYCNVQLDHMDDKKKGLERAVSDSETAIADAQEAITTMAADMKALVEGIEALDKSVAEASEQRKQEHGEFNDLMSSNSAAKELLNFAKNRLQAFYNPKLHKAEASLMQISTHEVDAVKETGAYTPMHEENNGVIAMMNLLIKDLDSEMTVAETDEKESQVEYAQTMQDAAVKRAADSKSLTQKTSAKADMEAQLQSHTDAKAADTNELSATSQYIHSLHGECDWLLQYFDVRKEARASEIDALGKAKAVLSGADYSLLQTRSGNFLKRSA